MNKPFSPACARNSAPILAVLRTQFSTARNVLEIGSGTGQHAACFAAALPHLTWQTSDLAENHAGILAWMAEAGSPNLLPPLKLDVQHDAWPAGPFDAVFTANTCHIMSWDDVRAMFAGIGRVLAPDGTVCIYGPFNVDGRFTSESNALFDAALRSQAPHMGIRDIGAVNDLAAHAGLVLVEDAAMPANNRLITWRKPTA
ncbi:MAG TPA: DUF938 domain-containing protein [Noviherbaspirillum sp.]|uniref:DUF938 domain-containing protein n=1 Tax=Noviherbaspirillum sp. TaxID=1926288 RepID=UPI002F928ACC